MRVDQFVTRSAEAYPDQVACVSDGGRLTYAQLEADSNRVAHALLDGGLQRGERVAIFLENGLEAVVSLFGVLKAGGAFVLLNPSLKARRLAFMLRDCAASVVVVGNRFEAVAEALALGAPSVQRLFTCGPAGRHEGWSLPGLRLEQDLAAFPETRPDLPGATDTDLSSIVYTSGSTGDPKGVAFTHFNMVAATQSITQYLENVHEDVVLNVLPLSFTYGLYQLVATTYVGARLVLEKSMMYPYDVVRKIKTERVTGMPGVPTVWAILLQMKDLEPSDLDSIRYLTNAGAALPPAHFERVLALFRRARFFSMYGVTEAVRVSYLPPEDLATRPASVGKGMPNQETWIADEQGNRVGPGVVGELVVRGANIMRGYWNLPEETDRALRPGRYPWERVLHTGDLFRMDEEGYLYFVARKDDIIKSRGEKVSPREVENVICEMPDVVEVAVFGTTDPILGEAVTAVVVPRNGTELRQSDVISYCARNLENYKVPKIVEFRRELPKTLSGKVQRNRLREGMMPAPDAEGQ